jgi:hypothetical protein
VEFAIDPTSPCQTAVIYGYSVAGGLAGGSTTADYGWWHEAYKYTPQPSAPYNAVAWVKVKPVGCTAGQQIYVKVFIPSDSVAVNSGGRFPTELDASALIDITPFPCCGPPLVSLAETPNPVTIPELGTQQLYVMGTFSDGSTVSCTTSCGGFATTYTSTGQITVNSTGLVTGAALTKCLNGSGTVTAHNNGINSPADNITVTNTATITGMTQMCNYLMGEGGYCASLYVYATLSDGSTANCTNSCCGYLTSWSFGGGCNYNYMTGQVCALTAAGCSQGGYCLYQAFNTVFSNTCSLTYMNLNSISSMYISPSSATIAEQGHVQLNAIATISDGSTTSCNTGCCGTATTWTPTGNVTVGASGLVTGVNVAKCAGGSGTVKATNNGHTSNVSNITVTNIDTVSSITVTPNPGTVSVGGTLQMTATAGISDGSTVTCTVSCCGTTTVWASGNVSIFTVSASGLITGVTSGTTIVTATNNAQPGTSSITVKGNFWVPTSTTNAPSARSGHVAVWTGSQMIIFGGGDAYGFFGNGAKYTPVTDSWSAMAPNGVGRPGSTAVWTGTEMIVWGGFYAMLNGGVSCGMEPHELWNSINIGGGYNPTTDSWAATTTTNAPSARVHHTAVWTGTRMIIWGGDDSGGTSNNSGGIYDPESDSWTPTSVGANVPSARQYHTAIWTGNEMIIWGGYSTLNTGALYNPLSDSWTPTSTGANVPSGRYGHDAVWTGTEMIVWGGGSNTGGRYNPASDSWRPTTTTGAPSSRSYFSMVWTGTKAIVWGGWQGDSTGGIYDPIADSWTATSTVNAPSARLSPAGIWAGDRMIVWGGNGLNPYDDTFPDVCPDWFFSDGGMYFP